MQDSERDWGALRKNVSKILKKEISLKDLKHIVAVLNVMESVGMHFGVDPAEPDFSVAAMMGTIQRPYAVSEFDPEQTMGSIRELYIQGKVSPEEFQSYYEQYKKKLRNQSKEIKLMVNSNDMRATKLITVEMTEQMLHDLDHETVGEIINNELIHAVLKEVYKLEFM